MQPDYDAKNETAFSLDDCKAAVKRKASLVLVGKVTKARESAAGPYVTFRPDKRFGLGDIGIDLDALELEE